MEIVELILLFVNGMELNSIWTRSYTIILNYNWSLHYLNWESFHLWISLYIFFTVEIYIVSVIQNKYKIHSFGKENYYVFKFI